ncbi:MAG TPA: hypothetical protein VG013_36435 [Gemmataceae bacterium]|jgi:hypothetical protein|nr:hypothetical protein [Gemmataceae bacterium]
MSQLTLEQRVAALEGQVADLRAALANGAGLKDWRRTMGMFAGDEVMKQIFDEALKFREADRARARRQRKPRRAK